MTREPLRIAGLFAGIGGLELGLHQAGHRGELLCEIDEGARSVLCSRPEFSGTPLVADIRELRTLPEVDLVVAGFPCQDLSQAGRTLGIEGSHSGLVDHVFRLLRSAPAHPRWVLFENVPFMLRLARGRAMSLLTRSLEELGYSWAYRVVDTRSFGLPQRRQRVLLLASSTEDPRRVLYADDAGGEPSSPGEAYGFYWTEGVRGLGWARDATPTLKGGSTIGIPSPPAIWLRGQDRIVLPDIRDAERLQGFPEDWTAPAMSMKRGLGRRWKLVGNAVSVPVAAWVGHRLCAPGRYDGTHDESIGPGSPWPDAAWGDPGADAHRAAVTKWPIPCRFQPLGDFLRHEPRPLSLRATNGFRSRTRGSSLNFEPEFLEAVDRHLERMSAEVAPLQLVV